MKNKSHNSYQSSSMLETQGREEPPVDRAGLTSSLLAHSAHPIMVINEDTSVAYVNPAFEKLTGFSAAEAIGETIPYPWWKKETWHQTLPYFQQGMAHGVDRYEMIFRKKGGEERWVEITSTTVTEGSKFKYHLVNCLDITERKQMEKALRESEHRYRSLFEESRDAICITTRKGTFLDVNQSALDLLGYTRADMMGLKTEEIYASPFDRSSYQQAIEKTGFVKDYPVKLRKKDGAKIDCLRTSTVWRDSEGSITGYQGIMRDITEQKRLWDAMRRSEKRYRSLFDSIRDGIMLCDSQGHILDANQALLDMLGYTKSEILSLTYKKLTPKKWHELDAGIVKSQILTRGYSDEHEKEYIKKDGTAIPVSIRVWKAKAQGGQPATMMAIIRDITERKQAEKKLITYQKQLRALASQLSLAEERQRHKVAVELHDCIGQALVVCKRNLEMLKQEPLSASGTSRVQETYETIGQTIKEVRSLVFMLSPPSLYEIGLEAAVKGIVMQIGSSHGIECSCEDDGQTKELDDDVRVLLFQTVRELLVNVIKHARASHARVSLSQVNSDIKIEVADDGIGFDPGLPPTFSDKAHGFGLFSIRERMRNIGGHLEIKSSPGNGTTVTVVAPLRVDSPPLGEK